MKQSARNIFEALRYFLVVELPARFNSKQEKELCRRLASLLEFVETSPRIWPAGAIHDHEYRILLEENRALRDQNNALARRITELEKT